MTEFASTDQEQALQQIRSNANLVVEGSNKSCGFQFGFDARSVAWLDGFIEKLRSGPFSDEQREGMEINISCYLGEAILRNFGGIWSLNEQGWHILFPIGTRAFPFSKVRKRFQDGEFDSIASFYRIAGEFAKPESERQFVSVENPIESKNDSPSPILSRMNAILTDSHFLVPLIVFCIGLALLITLH
jgi:hypothetical protein